MVAIGSVALLLAVTLLGDAGCQVVPSTPGGTNEKPGKPLFGTCDRIALQGVMNCAENFLPNRILFDEGNSLCCAYSKYKACISGLNDGLKASFSRAGCEESHTTQTVMSLGQNVIGLLPRLLCERGEGQPSACAQHNVISAANEREILNQP